MHKRIGLLLMTSITLSFGALPHIALWYEDFGITPADPMCLPVENRASIW